MGTYNIEVRIPGIQGGRGTDGLPGEKGEKGDPGSAAPETIVVAQNIDKVQTCATNVSDIKIVSTNMADVNSVGYRIDDVITVAGNTNAIKTVSNDITSVVAVAGDLANIDAASGYAALAKQYAVGLPTEPVENSAKWWAQHHGLVGKGEYSAAVTYNTNEWVTYTDGGYTTGYVSLIDSNVGNPVTDPSKWMEMYRVLNGTGVTWGTIGGTLANQTDLKSALDAKATKGTTLADYGITDASLSGDTVTLGANSGRILPSQATADAGKVLKTDGTNASWVKVDGLPDQTGSAGKYLSTDGAAAAWVDVSTLPVQTGHAGQYLTTDGTNASWSNLDVMCSESIWDTAALIPANSIVTIPGTFAYVVGAKDLLFSVDGLMYYRNRHFSEVGTTGSQSNQIRVLCDIPAGSELLAWSVHFGVPTADLEPRVAALESRFALLIGSVSYRTTPAVPSFPGSGTLTARIAAIENLANYFDGAVAYRTATPSLPPIPGTGTDVARVIALESWVPVFESVVTYRAP